MVVLATMAEKVFVPSLLEAPGPVPVGGKKGAALDVHYSIDTVQRLKQTLKKADRLFFLIGIDAFNDIAKWHQAEALFRECAFIVASRPGYSLADVANALPERLRPKAAVTKPFAKQPATGDLVLPGVTVHLLDGVQQNVSATTIREAVSGKKSLAKFVDPAGRRVHQENGVVSVARVLEPCAGAVPARNSSYNRISNPRSANDCMKKSSLKRQVAEAISRLSGQEGG